MAAAPQRCKAERVEGTSGVVLERLMTPEGLNCDEAWRGGVAATVGRVPVGPSQPQVSNAPHSKPVQSQPVQSKPMQSQPMMLQPVMSQPSQTEEKICKGQFAVSLRRLIVEMEPNGDWINPGPLGLHIPRRTWALAGYTSLRDACIAAGADVCNYGGPNGLGSYSKQNSEDLNNLLYLYMLLLVYLIYLLTK